MPEEPVYHLRFVLRPLKTAPTYASVYIRLEYGGEFSDFGVTGVKVKRQGFSNFIPQKAIEVREYVQDPKLVSLILEIKQTIQNKHPSNAKLIKCFVNNKAIQNISIIQLMEICKKDCLDIQKQNTQKSWGSKIETLKSYLHEIKKTKILAVDFTPVEVNNYINYLQHKGLKDSSIKVHKDKIGKAITWGFSKGIINKHALFGFKAYGLKAYKPNPQPLEWSFIEQIENHYFSQDTLKRARDMFVFCCYTGTSYTDLKNLSNQENLWVEHLLNDNNEKITEVYIKGEREKGSDEKQDVSKRYKVKLWGKALDILKEYGDLSKICTIDNSTVNKHIRHCFERIGVLPEVADKITFHKSRHTFASYLKYNKGLPNDEIMLQTGHTSEKSLKYYVLIKYKDSLVKYGGHHYEG